MSATADRPRGEWCLVVHAGALSPERPMLHFFRELAGNNGPALTLNAACGPQFPHRRRPKKGEMAQRCPLCEEKTR